MAERRMLWKSISQSRKVNRLSLKAALLYSWAIPWTDRDGFIEVEADYVKVNILPRRADISEEEIDGLVSEIVNQKLWVLYQHSTGTRVVQVARHDEMQKGMDQRKERESHWTNEINNLEKIGPNKYSTGTGGVQEGYSTGTVERKGKERKGKEIKETSKRIFEGLKPLASQIEVIYKNWNPWEAIQKAINNGYLVEDIEPALKYMSENKAEKPWNCFSKIIKAQKHTRLVKEREQVELTKKIEETRDVARLIKGIGGEG